MAYVEVANAEGTKELLVRRRDVEVDSISLTINRHGSATLDSIDHKISSIPVNDLSEMVQVVQVTVVPIRVADTDRHCVLVCDLLYLARCYCSVLVAGEPDLYPLLPELKPN